MEPLGLLPPRDSAAAWDPMARSGAILIASGGGIALSMAFLDPWPQVTMPVGIVGVLLAVYAWRRATRPLPDAVAIGFALAASALISVVVAVLGRPDDVGTGPVLYVWGVLHAALFFRRRPAQVVTGCSCALYTGIVLAERPMGIALAAAASTVVALCAVGYLAFTLRDRIDELVRQLHHDAQWDALTGVLNRQGFAELLATRPELTGSLLVIDVDHFKAINDTHGHAVGDAALAWLGQMLLTATASGEPEAVAARFGGEEFVVWLGGTEPAAAAEWAESLARQLQADVVARPVPLTVSVGVCGGGRSDLGSLMARADEALYRAKHSGRNAVRVA